MCGYNAEPDISEGLANVLKFKQPKVPAELHICWERPALACRAGDPKPAGKWIERFEEWLADSGFLKNRDLTKMNDAFQAKYS